MTRQRQYGRGRAETGLRRTVQQVTDDEINRKKGQNPQIRRDTKSQQTDQFLLVAQGYQRIDLGGALRRDITGDDRDQDQQHRHSSEG